MISLEQVKLLETRVVRAIEYVARVDAENAALRQKDTELRVKLESYQKRINELEVLVMRFKEDQSRIEDGILSALDRLSQFEEAVEKSLTEKIAEEKTAGGKGVAKSPPVKTQPARAETKDSPVPPVKPPVPEKPEVKTGIIPNEAPAAGEMFFEIPEEDIEKDIADPLAGEDGESSSPDGELDIF